MTADEKAFPHRLAFVVLHPDTPLPGEHEVDEFFCPGFWTGPDFKNFKSNYYFDWPSPGDWYELDLEKLDAALETVAILRLGRVRAPHVPGEPAGARVRVRRGVAGRCARGDRRRRRVGATARASPAGARGHARAGDAGAGPVR